jgi:hypothetical protein
MSQERVKKAEKAATDLRNLLTRKILTDSKNLILGFHRIFILNFSSRILEQQENISSQDKALEI